MNIVLGVYAKDTEKAIMSDFKATGYPTGLPPSQDGWEAKDIDFVASVDKARVEIADKYYLEHRHRLQAKDDASRNKARLSHLADVMGLYEREVDTLSQNNLLILNENDKLFQLIDSDGSPLPRLSARQFLLNRANPHFNKNRQPNSTAGLPGVGFGEQWRYMQEYALLQDETKKKKAEKQEKTDLKKRQQSEMTNMNLKSVVANRCLMAFKRADVIEKVKEANTLTGGNHIVIGHSTSKREMSNRFYAYFDRINQQFAANVPHTETWREYWQTDGGLQPLEIPPQPSTEGATEQEAIADVASEAQDVESAVQEEEAKREDPTQLALQRRYPKLMKLASAVPPKTSTRCSRIDAVCGLMWHIQRHKHVRYIYGGVHRDLTLRNEEPNDIDVKVDDDKEETVATFVKERAKDYGYRWSRTRYKGRGIGAVPTLVFIKGPTKLEIDLASDKIIESREDSDPGPGMTTSADNIKTILQPNGTVVMERICARNLQDTKDFLSLEESLDDIAKQQFVLYLDPTSRAGQLRSTKLQQYGWGRRFTPHVTWWK